MIKSNSGESAIGVSGPTVSHMLGEICWILAQSPGHKHFTFADMEWLVIPPRKHEQYRVFRDEARAPIGLALWAYLDKDAEDSLSSAPAKLRPDQWKSGDALWMVDLICPAATSENKLRERLLADLLSTALNGKVIKFHQFNSKSGEKEVRELGPIT